jgi:hypothetical protein
MPPLPATCGQTHPSRLPWATINLYKAIWGSRMVMPDKAILPHLLQTGVVLNKRVRHGVQDFLAIPFPLRSDPALSTECHGPDRQSRKKRPGRERRIIRNPQQTGVTGSCGWVMCKSFVVSLNKVHSSSGHPIRRTKSCGDISTLRSTPPPRSPGEDRHPSS